MKKPLAMALGAVLAAGAIAAPASATEIDVSGFYIAHYINSGNTGMTSEDNLDESRFASRLRLNVNFQATDAVSVHWRFHAPGGKTWGAGTHSDSLQSRFYYGQVVQDWGTIRVGRLPDSEGDTFGLSYLGWAPYLDEQFTYVAPFEGAGEYEGIQYSNSWDNGFKMRAAYAKVEALWNGQAINHPSGDHDRDRFQVEGAYEWEGGGASLNVMYDRDATGDGWDIDPDEDGAFLDGERDWGSEDKTTAWYLNPAVMHAWGPFSFHAEAKFGFGETQFVNNPAWDSNDPGYKKDADAKGQGFYLDFDYNYGPGRVNLAGWWASGNDYSDKENNALVAVSEGNFYPLIVAYGPIIYIDSASADSRVSASALGAVGAANDSAYLIRRAGANTIISGNQAAIDANLIGDTLYNWTNESKESVVNNPTGGTPDYLHEKGGTGSPVSLASVVDRTRSSAFNNGEANHWALMLSGQHSFTDEITFNYALAYLALNNPNYSVMDSMTVNGNNITRVGYHTQDKEIGWEVDFGVNVKLLDNLALTSTFGYLFAGDAFQSLQGYHANMNGTDTTLKAKWEDADDSYNWLTSLTFSF